MFLGNHPPPLLTPPHPTTPPPHHPTHPSSPSTEPGEDLIAWHQRIGYSPCERKEKYHAYPTPPHPHCNTRCEQTAEHLFLPQVRPTKRAASGSEVKPFLPMRSACKVGSYQLRSPVFRFWCLYLMRSWPAVLFLVREGLKGCDCDSQ